MLPARPLGRARPIGTRRLPWIPLACTAKRLTTLSPLTTLLPLPHTPAGRFVHTRNMTGLTDKAAERMKQVLLSGGDRDAPSIPGLGVMSPGSAGRASFSSSVGGSGATMSVEVPMAAEIHSSNGVGLGTPFKDSMMSALSAAGGLPRGRPAPLVTSAMPFRRDATEVGSPEPRAEPKSSMSTYDALGMGGTPGSPLRVGGSVSIFAGASPTSNRIAPTPAFNTLRGHTAGRSPLSPFGAPVRGANVDNSRMLPNLDGTRATVQARSIRSQTANVNGFGARGGGNTSQLQAYGSSYRAPTTLRPGGAY